MAPKRKRVGANVKRQTEALPLGSFSSGHKLFGPSGHKLFGLIRRDCEVFMACLSYFDTSAVSFSCPKSLVTCNLDDYK
jgi:hypothetical protein